MIKQITKAAGLKIRQTRHQKPQGETYGVYMDAVEAGGADGMNCIRTHDITLELYAPNMTAAEAAASAIEDELDARGIPWSKQGWYWLQDEQRYQEVYEFSYIEKRRINHG